jgi:hypothetical protein
MFTRACHAMMIGLGLYGSLTAYAAAQQKAGRDVVYEAARNRVGLLRYCREEKLLSAEVADIAIRVMQGELEAEPAAGQPLARKYGDYAEQDGEDGVLGPDSKRDVATFARSFKTTQTELCREWARESLRGFKGRGVQQAEPAPAVRPAAPPLAGAAKTADPSYLPPATSAVPKVAAPAPVAKPVPPASKAPPLVITTAPTPQPLVIATVPVAKAPPPITPPSAESRRAPPITAATVMIIPPSAPPPRPAPVAAQSPAPAYAAPAELHQSRPPAFVPSDVQCP